LALGVVLLSRPGFAQLPLPSQPAAPRLLPPAVAATSAPQPAPRTAPPVALPADVQTASSQEQPTAKRGDPNVVLPHREVRFRVEPSAIVLRQLPAGWQLWAGGVMFKDFGANGQAAQDALAAVRGLRPTEWAVIGGARPVVEYGLTNGEAPPWTASPRTQYPVDLPSVRAEPVRGAWVVADDANILLNFGPDRAGAEQAAAVAKRYGFNRIGFVGNPTPVFTFFFAVTAPPTNRPAAADPFAALVRASQEQTLARTAVDVPGVGLVGSRLAFDRGKIEVRKESTDWVLAVGPDVLARFGYSELAARDALRVVADGRYTEFCRVGGLTFFLANGLPPARVPFAAQNTRFDPARLTVQKSGTEWAVAEGGRVFWTAASADEAEQMRTVIRAYGFDHTCLVGPPTKSGLRFLAKTGGR
ncbi:MAG: hypothetical protein ACRC7O_19330, partial [Fimbriiglobus sp.]